MKFGELEVIHFRIRNVLDVVNMWDPKAPAMSPQNATNPQTGYIDRNPNRKQPCNAHVLMNGTCFSGPRNRRRIGGLGLVCGLPSLSRAERFGCASSCRLPSGAPAARSSFGTT